MKPIHSPEHRKEGFTLIEVVVALSVAALIALAAHSGLATLSELSLRAERARLETIHNSAVRQQLGNWIRSAVLNHETRASEMVGVPRSAAPGMRDDSLALPLRSNSQSGASPAGDAILEIFVDRTGNLSSGVLMAVITPLIVDPHPVVAAVVAQKPAPQRTVLIASGVEGLAIRYLLTSGTEQRWLPAWRSRHRLPEAIEIQILGDSVPRLLGLPLTVPLVTGG